MDEKCAKPLPKQYKQNENRVEHKTCLIKIVRCLSYLNAFLLLMSFCLIGAAKKAA